jgi:hypothetical protein
MEIQVIKSVTRHFYLRLFRRMRTVIVLAFCVTTPILLPRLLQIHAATSVLLGDTSVEATRDSNAAGNAEAFQTTATMSGTVGSVTVYMDTPNSATRLIVGIYSNSSGNPATLLSQGSSSTTLKKGAWNTVAITPVAVTANTVYWIAVLGTGGTPYFRAGGTNCSSVSSSQSTLTALPASWSTGHTWSSCRLSAYGSASSTTPILSISTATLSFGASVGGSNPASQSVNVSNTGTGGALSFTAASDAAWLGVSPGSGATPGTLQISAIVGVLTTATYTGHITVTSTGAQGSPATITVTFNVTTPQPVLSLSKTALSFSATVGGANPASQSVSGTNSGTGGALSFTAADDAAWLSVSPGSGTTPGTLQISATVGTLTAATYTGHITVTSTGAQGSPATITVTFTVASVPTYSISGTISPTGSGTTVTLSGAASAIATADTSGIYTFTGLANGSYTVTPTKTGFTFSPVSAPATVNNANVTALNFTSTANLAGQTLFTTQTPALTNNSDGSSANYELGTAFTSTVAGQIIAVRFWKASNETGTHTGRIWSSTGQLLTSVTFSSETVSGWQQQILATPLSIVASTQYVVSVNTGNTFYVATNSGLASQAVNGNLLSVVGKNGLYGSTGTFPTNSWMNSNYFRDIVFVAGTVTGTTYSVSGSITPSASGSGATVTLSGAAVASTTVDSSGNFSFTGLANGSYTVTPSKAGYTFSPANQSVTVSSGNVTVSTFTATATGLTYTISGTITPAASGSGATVTLSGAAVASTTADSSGNFSFAGVANGSYTVVPGKTGFNFSPDVQAVTINGANATGVSFTANIAPPDYSISGNIKLSSLGVGGGSTVTLTLQSTGAIVTSTLTNSSGSFLLTGITNGSYVVTPSSQTAVFTPASFNVTINGASFAGANFTAAGLVFYDDFTGTSLSSAWTVISRHGEYSQSETECNIPQMVSVANSALTITTDHQSATCGDFNIEGTVRHAPSTWPYITGDVQWTSLNFTYGTIEIRAKFPPSATNLWPATWLLGTNCQVTNIYTADTGYSTCTDLGASGYTEIDMTECYNGGGWCQFHVSNPSFGIGNGCDATYTVDTNYHVFTTVWTSISIKQYMDGALITTCNQKLSNPMFLIIQTQTGGIGGTPDNSQLPADFVIDYVKVTQP